MKDMEITGQRTKCTHIDIGWFGSFDFKTIYIEGFSVSASKSRAASRRMRGTITMFALRQNEVVKGSDPFRWTKNNLDRFTPWGMYLILVAMGILVFCIEPIYGSDWLGEASLATSISFL